VRPKQRQRDQFQAFEAARGQKKARSADSITPSRLVIDDFTNPDLLWVGVFQRTVNGQDNDGKRLTSSVVKRCFVDFMRHFFHRHQSIPGGS
jgi:hypothetical protein